jgi:hypothetical protein
MVLIKLVGAVLFIVLPGFEFKRNMERNPYLTMSAMPFGVAMLILTLLSMGSSPKVIPLQVVETSSVLVEKTAKQTTSTNKPIVKSDVVLAKELEPWSRELLTKPNLTDFMFEFPCVGKKLIRWFTDLSTSPYYSSTVEETLESHVVFINLDNIHPHEYYVSYLGHCGSGGCSFNIYAVNEQGCPESLNVGHFDGEKDIQSSSSEGWLNIKSGYCIGAAKCYEEFYKRINGRYELVLEQRL